MLVLIFGPSGAGKSTIINRLVAQGDIEYIIPQVTRPLRDGETDKEYVTREVFTERQQTGHYIWVNALFGELYGTPKAVVLEALRTAQPSHLLDFPLEAIATVSQLPGYKSGIVLMPPTLPILKDRLRACGREHRIADAELQFERYSEGLQLRKEPLLSENVITNVDLEAAFAAALEVIARLRREKLPSA